MKGAPRVLVSGVVLGQPMGGVRRHNAELLPRAAALLSEAGGELVVMEGREPVAFELPPEVRRLQSDGFHPAIIVRHEGLETIEAHLDRTGNRLALALVTLGLYIAASLLMLHSAGPRVLGNVPLLALLGYLLALGLSFRLVGAVGRSGRL